MDFEKNEVRWMERSVGMKHRGHWNQVHNLFLAITDDYDFMENEDERDEEEFEEHSYMLDAKYEVTTPHEVTEKQKHLTGTQKKKLESELAKYPDLFDGKLVSILINRFIWKWILQLLLFIRDHMLYPRRKKKLSKKNYSIYWILRF
jgi:hypothetical protein